MINKKIYMFLIIALLSFVSLSMFPATGFVESTPKNVIECAEQKNSIESESKDFSYLSFDSNPIKLEKQVNLNYTDKIHTLLMSNVLLRPPIFT